MCKITISTLLLCVVAGLVIGATSGEVGAVPVLLRQDTSDDCQLIFQTSERWQETNGTAGLQTTGANPDTQRGGGTNARIDCNIIECNRNDPCEVDRSISQASPREDFRWKYFCKCRSGRTGQCQGVLTGSTNFDPNQNQAAGRGKYTCEGQCGGEQICGDDKVQTSRAVTATAGNIYHVDATKKCVCPDP